MKLQAFECPNCKAPIEPLTDARFMFCPYCGAKVVIDDIEVYKENSKTERERIRANRDVQKHEIDNKNKAEMREQIITVILIVICLLVTIFLIALGAFVK